MSNLLLTGCGPSNGGGAPIPPALTGLEAGVQIAISSQRRIFPGYTGPLFRIEKLSDPGGAFLDVGFDAITNDVELGPVPAFLGEDTLRFIRWYLQDGSGRWYAGTTAARTPWAAVNGNLYTVDGKQMVNYYFQPGKP